MRIVITGNMGYVGPIVTQHLRNRFPDSTLVGVDVGFFGHCLAGARSLPESIVDIQHFSDVRDVDASILDGADALVMLAAISNDPMGKAFEAVTAEINRDACVRLTEIARDKGVGRVVFASSCSVYGFAEGGAKKEEDELDPLTAYARSKVDTEKAICDLANEKTLITCLRFPTACGMSPRIRLDLVLNDFVASAVATGKIQILSDGSPWRPLIDIRDMARAIEWAIVREAESGGQFIAINAGRDESNHQVRALAEAVKEVMPSVDIEINQDAQPDRRSYQVDFGRYRELAPNHLPAVSLAESIKLLRDGLEQMDFSDSEFRDSGFMRLKVLSGLRESGLLNERLKWTHAR
ncbi:MAG: NAD-dependent epimerase/dehydratase family protein [Woeseiaceae bacterium]